MRFLFNTVFYKPARGGGGPIHSVSALAEELVSRGHEVTVACSNKDIPGIIEVDTTADHWVDGVKVRYFKAAPTALQRTSIPMFARSGAFKFGPEFQAWLESSGSYDIVHSHISFTWSNGPCSLHAQKHFLPYLYHQRGNLDPIRLQRGYLKKWIYIAFVEKRVMRRANALIALTDYEIQTFRKQGLRNRVEVIPNGIDAEFGSSPAVARNPEIANLLERLQGRFVFLFLSRIHPVKGPELFAEAFIEATRGNPLAEAILAGPDELDTLARIRARLEVAGLMDRFHYAGTVTGSDKVALLQRSNCFVLPTLSEGMSMALLEALACGCPIITCPGAYFDVASKCGAGVVVARTAAALASAMRDFISEGSARLKERGNSARKLARDQFSWKSIAARYEALTSELSERARSNN